MEVAARLRHVNMAPQKVRLVVDQIRGMAVGKALNLLTFSTKQAADVIKKLLQSAIANAENNAGADIDELYVSTAFVDAGPTAKRTMPRAKGRADRILKRTSHVTIKVSVKQ